MLIIPPFRRKRKSRTATAAPVLPPIVVTQITYAGMSGANLVVEFRVDTTEEDGLADVSGADPAKWAASYGGTAFVGSAVQTIGFDELSVTLSPSGSSAGSEVSYAANPSDIASVSGRLLAGFEMELG